MPGVPLLLLWCLLHHISRVTSQAVPCLVYPPGHTWATLPTQISLRPTTTSWKAKLSLTDQDNKTLACLCLKPEGDQVSVALYRSGCYGSPHNTTKWSSKQFSSSSWAHMNVTLADNHLHLSLLSPESRDETNIFPSFGARNISLDNQESSVSVSYKCHNGCRYFSMLDSRDAVPMETLSNSATFYINPRPSFRNILFQATATTAFHTSHSTFALDRNMTAGTGTWNKVQVQFGQDQYRVSVHRHEKLLLDQTIPAKDFEKIYVLVEGAAYWSLNCEPRVITTKDPSAETPLWNTRCSFLVFILWATVLALVGSVADLILVLRLQWLKLTC